MIVSNDYKWPLMKDTITWMDRLKLASFVMTADRFTQGEKVAEFEQAWSEWLGAKHSVFVTSGSTANLLLLDCVRDMYFKDKKNVKVLLPACTWVTNINPVMQLGMTPIFCDINLKDFSFDLENAASIAKQHEIDIVFVTHLLGFPAPSAYLQTLFPNAIILDDVCESHGATDVVGDKIGSDSRGATFSFYYGHHMSTIEGGMISTNSPTLYNLLRIKRSHGMSRGATRPETYSEIYPEIDPQFLFIRDGYNFRNTELAAVLGLSQLKRLDGFIDQRRANYKRFHSFFKYGTPFLMPEIEWGKNSSFCFPLIADNNLIKDMLIRRLKVNRIEYRPIVGGNLLRQPYMQGHKIACKKGPYNVDILHDRGIYIGNNQFVGKKELDLLESIMVDLT